MVRNIFIAALVCCGVLTAGSVCVLGGCVAGRGTKDKASAVKEADCVRTRSGEPDEGRFEVRVNRLSEDPAPLRPGRVARLTGEDVTVEAVAYDANGTCGILRRVVLTPGTWLLPAASLQAPGPVCDGSGGGEHE